MLKREGNGISRRMKPSRRLKLAWFWFTERQALAPPVIARVRMELTSETISKQTCVRAVCSLDLISMSCVREARSAYAASVASCWWGILLRGHNITSMNMTAIYRKYTSL